MGKDQNICENNMLSALKKFNKSKLNLKQKLGGLHEQLNPVGNDASEKFKEFYNSVVNLIGECAKKNSDNFNISSDQDPLSQMYQKIIGKKIPSESVKQKNWGSEDIGITENSSISFPAESTPLKNELKDFLINLLKQIYPNKETVPASKQGLKTRNMKTIKTVTKTKSDPKSQNTNKQLLPPSQSPKIKDRSSGKQSVINKKASRKVPPPPGKKPDINRKVPPPPDKKPDIKKTNEHDSTNSQKSIKDQPLGDMKTPPRISEQTKQIASQELIEVSQMKNINPSEQTDFGNNRLFNLNKSIEEQKNVQSNRKPGGAVLLSENDDILNNFNKFHYNINDIINNEMEGIMIISKNKDNGVYKPSDEVYTYVIKSCIDRITELRNMINNRDRSANLTKNESNSIVAIKDCLNKFLKNPQIFDKEIDKTAPILALFEKLTGSSATLKDITNSYGDPFSSIAIKNMEISKDKNFNKSFKNCLAALMRIYNVKNNVERFTHFVTKMGEGSYGVANSYQLPNKRPNNRKEVVAKTFNDPNMQEQYASELIANTEIYHKTLKLKEESKEKEKKREIEKLGQELKQTKDLKRIYELKQEIEKLKSEKKALKSNRNRVINIKMRGSIIETKKGTGDLLKFMEKDMLNIVYGEHEKALTKADVTACMNGLIDDVINGVKQFHGTYKCVHRDIKPENFFVYPKKGGSLLGYKCKLADCDLSAKINDKFKYEFSGTPQYKPKLFIDVGKENKIARRLCIECANGEPGAALVVAEDNYALYETLNEIKNILKEYEEYMKKVNKKYIKKVDPLLFKASYDYACKQLKNWSTVNNNFSMFESIEKLKDFLIKNGAPEDELNNKLAKLNGSEKLDEDATDRILKKYYEMQNNSSELSNE